MRTTTVADSLCSSHPSSSLSPSSSSSSSSSFVSPSAAIVSAAHKNVLKRVFAHLSFLCTNDIGELVRSLGCVITIEEFRSHKVTKHTLNIMQWTINTMNDQKQKPKVTLERSTSLVNLLVNIGVSQQMANFFLCFTVHQPQSSKLEKVMDRLSISKGLLKPSPTVLETHVEDKDIRWVEEQSNSIHFISCYSDSDVRHEYKLKRQQELVPFELNTLYYWTVGRPKSEDTIGFLARAKLRVIFKSDSPNAKYLYIERMYGKSFLLAINIMELAAWWDFKTTKEGWENKGIYYKETNTRPYEVNERLAINNEFKCPSAAFGYQDTLDLDANSELKPQYLTDATFEGGVLLVLRSMPHLYYDFAALKSKNLENPKNLEVMRSFGVIL